MNPLEWALFLLEIHKKYCKLQSSPQNPAVGQKPDPNMYLCDQRGGTNIYSGWGSFMGCGTPVLW